MYFTLEKYRYLDKFEVFRYNFIPRQHKVFKRERHKTSLASKRCLKNVLYVSMCCLSCHPKGLNTIIIARYILDVSKDIINDSKFPVNVLQYAVLCQSRYSL